MALRVIRVVIPSGTAALSSVNIVQKARVHTSPIRSLRYGWWAYALGERTTPRLTRLSKIFSVEGNLASGKGALAQKLADKLGMLYMPEADTFYMDKMTGEKQALPVDFNGMCSLEKFYTDPKAADGNSYRLQHWMYIMRLLQYADAIEHMLTTGQGVILERSPFSDVVFLEAMSKQGYIRKACVDHYNEIKHISICEFLPPHLVIYIDQPAEEVQKKLKQSSKPYLHNVPLEYLKSIEDSYKKTYLPSVSDSSELLAYDITQAQDIEKVAEDIEYLSFEKGPWLEQDDVTYHHMRMLVEDKNRVAALTHIPKFLPEITIGAHDFDEKYYAYRSLPGKKYTPGYNADIGDKNVLFK
ncbi:NADH dehydrogenase [ubiquinone] 1 alpha subcomplex subunit 10, mitochondrial [Periophthalmus magnuspinnatus]|uniref:NADH dehydrogenase [ubiquinone] 1 alpha subcomplex subunit 10, mitochondrial n=1 Tax=Periophthalmus magnuspinnatus TaxID=409849 RepID=UPI00145AF324|nr:NADH dehydrogenase [ubiquinone] 1 alpha subcomplex subunit 10, mitochondrial [Periophthalmus magnuspinnatus]XP_055086437.1 NADH dehydrogenase [ubiquinone] 1 alpha subcomplex subunit 10, mitochondrial [Periophthalmus magnuspinnatus]